MLLNLLYYFLKVYCPILANIYYRIKYLNPQNFNLPQGACIMVSNHPNTLVDVILTVPKVNRKSHFLANAGLFKTRFFNWFWRTLWCIPIKRRQDNVTTVNNDESFRECDLFLSKGGLLFIAPEGSSTNERHLRSFKTGTARIAFSAESKNNFQLGLTICPFGVTYERPWRFRSNAFVNAGLPVRVADFKDAFLADAEKAIDDLTLLIENETRKLIVDASDRQQDELIYNVETLLDNETQQKLSLSQRFERAQNLSHIFKQLQKEKNDIYDTFAQLVNQYTQRLSQLNLSDKAVANPSFSFSQFLLLILGFPVFLLGFIINLIPYGIIEFVWQKLKLTDYEATFRIAAGGVLVFPLYYWAITHFARHWIDFPMFGVLFWCINIILGIFAWQYWQKVLLLLQKNRFNSLNLPLKKELLELRGKIIKNLNQVK